MKQDKQSKPDTPTGLNLTLWVPFPQQLAGVWGEAVSITIMSYFRHSQQGAPEITLDSHLPQNGHKC